MVRTNALRWSLRRLSRANDLGMPPVRSWQKLHQAFSEYEILTRSIFGVKYKNTNVSKHFRCLIFVHVSSRLLVDHLEQDL